MLSIYPVPGTVFCVFHDPSNLIFPAPSSCRPLSLHLFGLGWGITKIIRIKGCNKKAQRTLTAPPTCYTAVAGSSRPKEQLSCDQGVSPFVNLPRVPTFAHSLPQLPVFVLFFVAEMELAGLTSKCIQLHDKHRSGQEYGRSRTHITDQQIGNNWKKMWAFPKGSRDRIGQCFRAQASELGRTGLNSSSTTY